MANSSSAVAPSNLPSNLPKAGSKLLSPASPSFVAAVIGGLTGLALLGFSIHLFANTGTSQPLNMAIVVLGITQLACAYYTLRTVRVAWAFALSINGTAAVVLLFSAPRIRDAADVSILVALLPCVLASVIVILHSLKPEDF